MIYCKNFFDDDGCQSYYIGSHNEFEDREGNHKRYSRNSKGKHYDYKVYKTIRANGGWDNWQFIHLGSKECETEKDSRMIEQYEYIDIFEPDLNSQRAYISKEEKAKYKKNWYLNAKEINPNHNKEKQDRVLKKNPNHYKELYQKNKHIDNAKHLCQCGRIFTWHHKKRHEQTEYHKKRINCEPCS